jgi:hypothetical protein
MDVSIGVSKCQNVVQVDDQLFRAVPCTPCSGCAFRGGAYPAAVCAGAPCDMDSRSDGESVIFVKVEF